MAFSDADARLASFLSSGRADFSFLPPRNSSYAVRGEFASGQAAPVNPSLLSLFEKRLKPSYHVGLTVCEAATLEASLRSQSEALSQSMCVLSGLLGFMRLQNFALVDSSLFNTLVTSLSKSLAHQATLCASHTAFLVLKRRQFYLSHLPVYFSDITSVLCLRLRQFVPTSCSPRLMSLACCRILRPFHLCGPNRPWWMLPRARLVLVLATPVPVILLLGSLRLAAIAESLALLLVARNVCGLTPLLLPLL